MTIWEYGIARFTEGDGGKKGRGELPDGKEAKRTPRSAVLEAWGKAGWELVSVVPTYTPVVIKQAPGWSVVPSQELWYFKRQID